MTSTISISIDRILESIYALAAVDTLQSPPGRSNVVCRDDAPALRRLVRDSAAAIIFGITPPVTGSSLSDPLDDGDIITVDLELPEDAVGRLSGTIRPLLESALSAQVLCILWTGTDAGLGDMYMSMVRDAVSSLKRKLSGFDRPGFIHPAA